MFGLLSRWCHGLVAALHGAEIAVPLPGQQASATIAATASVAGTNLLGGLVKVNNIESSCVAGPGGIVRTSQVGSINGMPIGSKPGVIGIPGVAQVFYNENTSSGGVLGRNAIRIQTILGQQIILAACRLG